MWDSMGNVLGQLPPSADVKKSPEILLLEVLEVLEYLLRKFSRGGLI
jgi:hypothetical protein